MRKVAMVLAVMMSVVASSVQAQLMWRVKRDDCKTLYFFGTHHMAPVSVIDSLPMDEVITSVDKVYGELNLEAFNDMMGGAMMSAMMAPADSTLTRVLSAAELARLNDMLVREFEVSADEASMLVNMYSGMKPAALSMALSALAATRVMPEFDMSQQLDRTILTRASEAGRQVGGLETVAEQIDAVMGATISIQARDLMKEVDNPVGLIEQMKRVNLLYMAGDVEGLARYMAESGEVGDTERLIENRNNAWFDFLLGMIPTTSILVICGAGHLGGDGGMLNKFRSVGFNVEPVERIAAATPAM